MNTQQEMKVADFDADGHLSTCAATGGQDCDCGRHLYAVARKAERWADICETEADKNRHAVSNLRSVLEHSDCHCASCYHLKSEFR